MARYRVLAVQLNRITRDTMKERASDREVEYLEQGAVVDDFTDAEVKRYTAGTHPSIVEVDDNDNPVQPVEEQPAPMPIPPAPVDPTTLPPNTKIVGATELEDVDAVASGQVTDGQPLDTSQDGGKLVDKTPAPGGPDQQPQDVKPRKATGKTVTRGGVKAGNIGESDAKDDAPDFG